MLSRIHLFATPWTVTHQAPLSMGFSRQEYWSELPFLLQGIFLTHRSNLCFLHLLNWQADYLPLHHLGSLNEIRLALNQIWFVCSYMKRKETERGKHHVRTRDTQTQRADNHVKIKAEHGSMLSQVKQCLGLSEAGRSKEGSYLRGLELGLSCQHLDFELLASRTVRE